MSRINPFRPNAPVPPGMFVGRGAELQAIEQALVQTRAGLPKNLLLVGERGIGKTSLLLYLKALATSAIGNAEAPFDFLVVETDIDKSTSAFGLIKKIQAAVQRCLQGSEPTRAFLAKAWGFVQRIEAAGVKITEQSAPEDIDILLDEFAYSLAVTGNRVCGPGADGALGATHDGLVVLIDEADSAQPELHLGTFVKLLSERLQRHGCPYVLLALAGLPRLRDVLRSSHASSLRLFDELELERLSTNDVQTVLDLAIIVANQINGEVTTMDDDAREMLVAFSEGYPHFIQQFGYSAFAADNDRRITANDVLDGATGERGALETIGNRYYRDDFYNKIREDSYRQVLRIMAERLDGWITKKDIRRAFSGSDATLTNAIKALRDRKIIVSKEGAQGVYCLQHKAFALWIMLYTKVDRQPA